MGENPIVEELYSKIGGDPDKYDDFVTKFREDARLRTAVYKNVGIENKKMHEFDALVMDKFTDTQADPEEVVQETSDEQVPPTGEDPYEALPNLPEILERVQLEGQPQYIMAPSEETQNLKDYFNITGTGRSQMPVMGDDGKVEIKDIPNYGEFGEIYAEGDELFADFNWSSRHIRGFSALKGGGSGTEKVYLGPTDEFMETYNAMPLEERQALFKNDENFKNKVVRASLREFNNKMSLTDEDEVKMILEHEEGDVKALRESFARNIRNVYEGYPSRASVPFPEEGSNVMVPSMPDADRKLRDRYFTSKAIREKGVKKAAEEIAKVDEALSSAHPELFKSLDEVEDQITDLSIKRETYSGLGRDVSEIDSELRKLITKRSDLMGTTVQDSEGNSVVFGELPEMQYKNEQMERVNALNELYLEHYRGSSQEARDKQNEKVREKTDNFLKAVDNYSPNIPLITPSGRIKYIDPIYGIVNALSRVEPFLVRTAGGAMASIGHIFDSPEAQDVGMYLQEKSEALKGSINQGQWERKQYDLKDGNIAVLSEEGDIIGIENSNGYPVNNEYNDYQLYRAQKEVEDNIDKAYKDRDAGRLAKNVEDVGLDLATMLIPGAGITNVGGRIVLAGSKMKGLQGLLGGLVKTSGKTTALKLSTKAALAKAGTSVGVYTSTFGRNYLDGLQMGLSEEDAASRARKQSGIEALMTIAIGGIESRITGMTGRAMSASQRANIRSAVDDILRGKPVTAEKWNTLKKGTGDFIEDVIKEEIEELGTEVLQNHVDYAMGLGDGNVDPSEASNIFMTTLGLTGLLGTPGLYTTWKGMQRPRGTFRSQLAESLIRDLDYTVSIVDEAAATADPEIPVSDEQKSMVIDALRDIKSTYDNLPTNLTDAEKKQFLVNEIALIENDLHEKDDLRRAKVRELHTLENTLIVNKDKSVTQLQETLEKLGDLYYELYDEVPGYIKNYRPLSEREREVNKVSGEDLIQTYEIEVNNKPEEIDVVKRGDNYYAVNSYNELSPNPLPKSIVDQIEGKDPIQSTKAEEEVEEDTPVEPDQDVEEGTATTEEGPETEPEAEPETEQEGQEPQYVSRDIGGETIFYRVGDDGVFHIVNDVPEGANVMTQAEFDAQGTTEDVDTGVAEQTPEEGPAEEVQEEAEPAEEPVEQGAPEGTEVSFPYGRSGREITFVKEGGRWVGKGSGIMASEDMRGPLEVALEDAGIDPTNEILTEEDLEEETDQAEPEEAVDDSPKDVRAIILDNRRYGRRDGEWHYLDKNNNPGRKVPKNYTSILDRLNNHPLTRRVDGVTEQEAEPTAGSTAQPTARSTQESTEGETTETVQETPTQQETTPTEQTQPDVEEDVVEEDVVEEEEGEEENPVYRERRKKGFFKKAGRIFRRQKKVAENSPKGKSGKVRFTPSVNQGFTYALLEADDVQPSHTGTSLNPQHFIPEAQPKDRTKTSSKVSSDKIAEDMDFDQVSSNPVAYFGAPIVNARGEVIQGNNRAIGIKKHYGLKTTTYKESLANRAADFGFTPEQVNSMNNPVLVRVTDVGDVDAIKLGQHDVSDLESGGSSRINPITVARKMTAKIKGKIMRDLFPEGFMGTIAKAINDNSRSLVEAIKPLLNITQVEGLTREDGSLSPEGREDLQSLVLEFLFDGAENEIRERFNSLSHNTQMGLLKSVGYILSAPRGKRLLKEVQKAIDVAGRFMSGTVENPDEFLTQSDMFEGAPIESMNDLEVALYNLFIGSTRQSDIFNVFKEYNNLIQDKESPLFPDETVKGMSKVDAVNQLFELNMKESDFDVVQEPDTVVEETTEEDTDDDIELLGVENVVQERVQKEGDLLTISTPKRQYTYIRTKDGWVNINTGNPPPKTHINRLEHKFNTEGPDAPEGSTSFYQPEETNYRLHAKKIGGKWFTFDVSGNAAEVAEQDIAQLEENYKIFGAYPDKAGIFTNPFGDKVFNSIEEFEAFKNTPEYAEYIESIKPLLEDANIDTFEVNGVEVDGQVVPNLYISMDKGYDLDVYASILAALSNGPVPPVSVTRFVEPGSADHNVDIYTVEIGEGTQADVERAAKKSGLNKLNYNISGNRVAISVKKDSTNMSVVEALSKFIKHYNNGKEEKITSIQKRAGNTTNYRRGDVRRNIDRAKRTILRNWKSRERGRLYHLLQEAENRLRPAPVKKGKKISTKSRHALAKNRIKSNTNFKKSVEERFGVLGEILSIASYAIELLRTNIHAPNATNSWGVFMSHMGMGFIRKDAEWNTIIHELFSHPFMKNLRAYNRTALEKIYSDAPNYRSHKGVKSLYKTKNRNTIIEESLTFEIDSIIGKEIEILNRLSDEEAEEHISRMIEVLPEEVKDMMDDTISIEDIPTSITPEHLAIYLMYGTGRIDLDNAKPPKDFYENLEPGSKSFYLQKNYQGTDDVRTEATWNGKMWVDEFNLPIRLGWQISALENNFDSKNPKLGEQNLTQSLKIAREILKREAKALKEARDSARKDLRDAQNEIGEGGPMDKPLRREDVRIDSNKTPQKGDRVVYAGAVWEVNFVTNEGKMLVTRPNPINGENSIGIVDVSPSDPHYEGVVKKDTPFLRFHISAQEVSNSRKNLARAIIDFFRTMAGESLNIIESSEKMHSRLADLGYKTLQGLAINQELIDPNSKQRMIKSESGRVYGFYDSETNTIYLDPEYLNPETTIEEISHAIQFAIRASAENGDAGSRQILRSVELALGKEVDKFINGKVDNVYGVDLGAYSKFQGETDQQYRDRLIDEAWAKLMTPRAINKFRLQKGNFAQKMVGMWNKMKNWFLRKLGIKDSKIRNIDQLMDNMSDDLLRGRYFENKNNLMLNAIDPTNMTPEQYRTMLLKDIAKLTSLMYEKGQTTREIDKAIEKKEWRDSLRKARVKVRGERITNNPTGIPEDKTPEEVKEDKERRERIKKRQEDRAKEHESQQQTLIKAYKRGSGDESMSDIAAQRTIETFSAMAHRWASKGKDRTPEQFFEEILPTLNLDGGFHTEGQMISFARDPLKWASNLGSKDPLDQVADEIAFVFAQLLTPEQHQAIAKKLKGDGKTWVGDKRDAHILGLAFEQWLDGERDPDIDPVLEEMADFIKDIVSGVTSRQLNDGNKPVISPSLKHLSDRIDKVDIPIVNTPQDKQQEAEKEKVDKAVDEEWMKGNHDEYTAVLNYIHGMTRNTGEWNRYKPTKLEYIVTSAFKRGYFRRGYIEKRAREILDDMNAGNEYGTGMNRALDEYEQVVLMYVTDQLTRRYQKLERFEQTHGLDHRQKIKMEELRSTIDDLTTVGLMDGSVTGLKLGLRAAYFNRTWSTREKFARLFKMRTGQELKGHPDEKEINKILDQLEKNAEDMSSAEVADNIAFVEAIIAEGDDVVKQAKKGPRKGSFFKRFYDMFKGKTEEEKKKEIAKTVREFEKLNEDEIDTDIEEFSLLKDPNASADDLAKIRNKIRKIAIGVLSSPDTYGDINTFSELYAVVTNLIDISKFDLFDAMKEPTKQQIDDRKAEIEGQKKSLENEVNAFEDIVSWIDDVEKEVKTGKYKKLPITKDSKELKALVDQILYAASLDGELAATAFQFGVEKMSAVLDIYDEIIESITDSGIDTARGQEIANIGLEKIRELLNAYNEKQKQRNIENRISILKDKLKDVGTDKYAYFGEFVRNNNPERDLEIALIEAARRSGSKDLMEEVGNIHNNQNIYMIIRQVGNAYLKEGATNLEEVISKTLKALHDTGHTSITERSIMHAMFAYRSPKKVIAQAQEHARNIKKQGKAINDLMNAITSKISEDEFNKALDGAKDELEKVLAVMATQPVQAQKETDLEVARRRMREFQILVNSDTDSEFLRSHLKSFAEDMNAMQSFLNLDITDANIDSIKQALKNFSRLKDLEKFQRAGDRIQKAVAKIDSTEGKTGIEDLTIEELNKVPGLISKTIEGDVDEYADIANNFIRVYNEKVKNIVLKDLKERAKNNPDKETLDLIRRVVETKAAKKRESRALAKYTGENIALKNKLNEFLVKNSQSWWKQVGGGLLNASRLMVLAADMSYLMYQGALGIPFLIHQSVKDVANGRTPVAWNIMYKTMNVLANTLVPTRDEATGKLRFKGGDIFAQYMNETANMKSFPEYIDSGLVLSNPLNGDLEEELNLTTIFEKLMPVNVGGGKKVNVNPLRAPSRLIRQFSERGYSVYMNALRIAMFEEVKQELDDKVIPQELRDEILINYAEYVNTLTGAGQKFIGGLESKSNKDFNSLLDLLRMVFISPRLYASSFKSLFSMMGSPAQVALNARNIYRSRDKNLSDEERARALSKFIVPLRYMRTGLYMSGYLIGASMLGAALFAAGGDDEDKEARKKAFKDEFWQPYSPNFLKIHALGRVIQTTPYAGYARWMLRTLSTMYVQGLTEMDAFKEGGDMYMSWIDPKRTMPNAVASIDRMYRGNDLTAQDLAKEFLDYKILPAANAWINTFILNVDYRGEPITGTFKERMALTLMQGYMPILGQGLITNAMEGVSSPAGVAIELGLDILGTNAYLQPAWGDIMVREHVTKHKFSPHYDIGKKTGNTAARGTSFEVKFKQKMRDDFGRWVQGELNQGRKPSKRTMEAEWKSLLRKAWIEADPPNEMYKPVRYR